MSKKALISLSGGMDSCISAFWALNEGYELHAISFDYGQRNLSELKWGAKIAKDLCETHQVVDLKGLFGASQLIGQEGAVNQAQSNYDKELPDSFVPARNIVFTSIAASIAAKNGCECIILGTHLSDYDGYPDCRPEFWESMHKAINIGLGVKEADYPQVVRLDILLPILTKTKAEIFMLAKELGQLDYITNNTMSDYYGDETMNYWGMGRLDNNSSKQRKEAYDEAFGIKGES